MKMKMTMVVAAAGVVARAAFAAPSIEGVAGDFAGLNRRAAVSVGAYHLKNDWDRLHGNDWKKMRELLPEVLDALSEQRGFKGKFQEIDRAVAESQKFLAATFLGSAPRLISQGEEETIMRTIDRGRALLTEVADELRPLQKVIAKIQKKKEEGWRIVRMDFGYNGGDIGFLNNTGSYLNNLSYRGFRQVDGSRGYSDSWLY